MSNEKDLKDLKYVDIFYRINYSFLNNFLLMNVYKKFIDCFTYFVKCKFLMLLRERENFLKGCNIFFCLNTFLLCKKLFIDVLLREKERERDRERERDNEIIG